MSETQERHQESATSGATPPVARKYDVGRFIADADEATRLLASGVELVALEHKAVAGDGGIDAINRLAARIEPEPGTEFMAFGLGTKRHEPKKEVRWG